MTVENRKLFANRDARRRLSAMGGIMASSPELLGEAQLYADGGSVGPEQYVVVIPGIADRPIRLSGRTLERLNSMVPELMMRSFVMDQASAEQQGVDVMRLRPGDAFIERRITETSPALGVDITSMRVPGTDVSPVMGPSSIDQAPSLMGSAVPQMGIPMQPPSGALQPSADTANPSMPLNEMERLYASGALDSTLSNIPGRDGPPTRPTRPRGVEVDMPTNIGGLYSFDEAGNVIGGDQSFGARFASTPGAIPPSAAVAPELPVVEDVPGGYVPPEIDLLDLLPSKRMTMEQAAQGEFADVVGDLPEERRAEVSAPKVLSATDMERLARESADAAAAEREAAGITDARGSMGAAIVEGRPEDAAKIAENARSAPPAGPNLDKITDAATDPNLTPDQRLGAVTTTVLTGLGVENAGDMSVKDRVAAYESLFKEMLGEKDEDLQKEMWMNMAMIGFAIAAGESPNALQNISQGLLQGTKMMREDKATRQAREDKIRMLAISEGLTDVRDQEKFGRDLQLAQIRATGTRKEVGVPPHPLTAFAAIDQLLGPEERTAEENRILSNYSLSQIQEWAPQFEARWKSFMGPETNTIENGMKYIGPSYNREAAGKEENWVKVE